MLKLKKLLVLGGCGLIGAEVVRDLAATSEFEKITVADGDYKKAQELVASLNDPRFDARAVQVRDKASVSFIRPALTRCTSPRARACSRRRSYSRSKGRPCRSSRWR